MPATSDTTNQFHSSMRPSASGGLVAEERPAGQERHRELADVARDAWRVGERATLLADEQRRRHEPGDARGEDVDGEPGDDVVDPERRRDEGEQESAEQPADGAAEQRPPRAVLPAPPAADHGAEDHHPLETDVHRAAALGVEPAETGHGDRRRRADRHAHRPRRRQVVVVGDRPGDRHRQHGRQRAPQPQRPGNANPREPVGACPAVGGHRRHVVAPNASGGATGAAPARSASACAGPSPSSRPPRPCGARPRRRRRRRAGTNPAG